MHSYALYIHSRDLLYMPEPVFFFNPRLFIYPLLFMNDKLGFLGWFWRSDPLGIFATL